MAKVKAVPDGYATVTPFLQIKGAAKAIDFYRKAFGAEERARMVTPDGLIMHAEIKIGNSIVMISDALMGPPTQAGCHLYFEDVDAAWKRVTEAGATVVMPLADQFWGDRYGVVTDPFGNKWSMATHKEDFSPEEMRKRAEEAMKSFKA